MFYEDNHIKIYNKDCRSMDELPDESVQMVCCSPPYWGLRKYSGEQELIWGDNHCEHQWANYKRPSGGGHPSDSAQVGAAKADVQRIYNYQAGFCSLCGAWKGAYGLEPTPEMYIEHTIEILREIRRVLRKDGVVFWNIGDSYAGSGSPGGDFKDGKRDEYLRPYPHGKVSTRTGMEPVTWSEDGKPKKKGMTRVGAVKGLKPKDLCLIPFRVAIAAQEDGWWVRSIIIWSKPNPMPESVTDRPTESHEYILMLTKSKKYYWDADAVREPISESYADDKRPHGVLRQRFYPNSKYVKAGMIEQDSSPFPTGERATGRNIRSVWEFPTQPYPEAHFAVFPEKLPEICIKAATPEVGCCSKCGAPWERITETSYKQHRQKGKWEDRLQNPDGYNRSPGMSKYGTATKISETLGWQPTCKCNADKVPSIVLDPMMGAGTTLWVAKKLNRYAVGCDTSVEYCQLAVDRCRQQVLL